MVASCAAFKRTQLWACHLATALRDMRSPLRRNRPLSWRRELDLQLLCDLGESAHAAVLPEHPLAVEMACSELLPSKHTKSDVLLEPSSMETWVANKDLVELELRTYLNKWTHDWFEMLKYHERNDLEISKKWKLLHVNPEQNSSKFSTYSEKLWQISQFLSKISKIFSQKKWD